MNIKPSINIKTLGIALAVVGLAFILFFSNIWLNRNNIILPDELITIEVTVKNKLELERRRKPIRHYMQIQAKEYPNVIFEIRDIGTQAMKSSQIQQYVKIGDRIQIDVLKEDYEKLIFGPNSRKEIEVYGVRDNKIEYLKIKDFNNEFRKANDPIFFFLLLGFFLFMIGTGIKLYLKN